MSNPTLPSSSSPSAQDYETWSSPALIARISSLETSLSALTTTLSKPDPLSTSPRSRSRSRRARRKAPRKTSASPSPINPTSSSKPVRKFSMAKYSTRAIALKIAYLGGRYNGFEHANGNVTPLPTVEEVLWCALRKTRLIALGAQEEGETGGGGDTREEGMDVIWGRKRGMPGWEGLKLDWEGAGADWSKAGRTDRGVSAAGQVVGVRVRSKRKLEVKSEPNTVPESGSERVDLGDGHEEIRNGREGQLGEEMREKEANETGEGLDDMPFGLDPNDVLTKPIANQKLMATDPKTFDDIKDELPYLMILNAVLPPDIRVLAWCPNPPPDFNARFSCRERRYRYFFTNPGFLPTPGPAGFQDGHGNARPIREGWLDIDRMREAAQKLLGSHDFRNFCRLDTTKQMTSCQRQIRHVEIEEASQQSGPVSLAREPQLQQTAMAGAESSGPKVYSFNVHGSSFLWHQVRHMVAVLFLVGQGLEAPSVVDDLLDIEKNPCKPTYGMASDSPLVLWDCIFPKDLKAQDNMEDGLNWVYAGDEVTLPSPQIKWDGKYGMDGIADELFVAWHDRKIGEVIAGSVLDQVIKSGDGTSETRGPPVNAIRSQKLFDGSANGQLVGKYIPVMQKSRTDPLEVQNERWRVTRENRNMLRAKEREEARSAAVHTQES